MSDDGDSDLFELDIDVLRNNVIKLFVATPVNVVAMSLKDANKLTLVTLPENINEEAMVYVTFTFCESNFSIRVGLTSSNLEIKTYNKLIENEKIIVERNGNVMNDNKQKYPKQIPKLIADYAIKRRFIKKLIFLLGFVMALTWKDALKANIFICFSTLAKYSAILMEFVYAIIVPSIVSFFIQFYQDLIFLYPHDNDYCNLSLKLKTKQLKIVVFILLSARIFRFYSQRLLSLDNNDIINSIFDACKLIFGIINIFLTISVAAIVIRFFLDVIVQVMDESLIYIALSIEIDELLLKWQHDSMNIMRKYRDTTRRTHITTKPALRTKFLFVQEGKHEFIIQREACLLV